MTIDEAPIFGIAVVGPSDISYPHDGSETTTDSSTYLVNDGALDSNVVTVSITINPANAPPVAVAGGPYFVSEGGSPLLDGSASWDSDDTVLLWSWDCDGDSIPAGGGALFSGCSFDDDGAYVVTLIVTDPAGSEGLDLADVVVTNLPPTILSVPSPSAVQDTEYGYPAVAADPGADPLTWSLVTAPLGMVVDPFTGEVTWTPGATDVVGGPWTVSLEAADGDGGNDVQTWTLTVYSSDTDGDGIPDEVEGVADADGDGLPNSEDLDSDADDLADALEGDADSGLDGLGDFLDLDSDDGGLADQIEGPTDSDGDGLRDSVDLDSDDDGLSDLAEGTADSDGDGLRDSLDSDSDDDGHGDGLEGGGDADADGLPNYVDLDSDDDGADDASEGYGDADGDGVPDALDPVDDIVPPPDPDGDGLSSADEDQLGTDPDDPDSDGDGIEDGTEVGDPADPEDTDADGLLDALDDDSDGDGIEDAVEGEADPDEDGLGNWRDLDSDGDGLSDEDTGEWLDADGDEIPDFVDLNDGDGPDADPDGELLTNAEEAEFGSDPQDSDSDDDGLDDGEEWAWQSDPTEADTDGDGLDDGADVDVGGDPTLSDTDQDGLGDGEEVALGTGITNPDTDGDSFLDGEEVEAFGTDPSVPNSDFDGDRWPDPLDNCPFVENSDQGDNDSDGVGDHCDNNDGNEVEDADIAGLSMLAGPVACDTGPRGPGVVGSEWAVLLAALLRRRSSARQSERS